MGGGGVSRSRDEYELVDGRRAAGREIRRRRARLILVIILLALFAAGVVAGVGYLGWLMYSLRPAVTTNGTTTPDTPTNYTGWHTTGTPVLTTVRWVDDRELLEVTAAMWTLARPHILTAGTDFTITMGGQVNLTTREDHAPLRLFQQVNVDVRTWTRTSETFVRLLDNYNYVTKVQETYTDTDRGEIEAFLDAVINTAVMRKLGTFLVEKGFIGTGEDEFRQIIHEAWFGLYSRSPKYNITDSSGFEHVFVGEIRKNKVIGFHSWIQFYLQEMAGLINYQGYLSYPQPHLINVRLRWHDKLKSQASFFVGTPPEYDLAIYSLCMIVRTGRDCPVDVNGQLIHLDSYEVKHKEGIQVATVFAAI